MENLIKNDWVRAEGSPFAAAKILNHDVHPEGLDVSRLRFVVAGKMPLDTKQGQIVSVLQGIGGLKVGGSGRELRLQPGIHLYVPPAVDASVEAQTGMELLLVSGVSASQARGGKLLLRDERFLSASASEGQALRWILTPQYLSRRVFLHHDETLLSKSGNPVSWFRTTMFDVAGLPLNEDGEPVFKMSYNSRTEFNVCYHVEGLARVRMALHPYQSTKQHWGPWLPLDADSTYHLNEAPPREGSEPLRNKHEVYIINGHVTLFCLFDPAPTGIERHQPGEYSDYEPLDRVVGTPAHVVHQREITRYDEMVDSLSLAAAAGTLELYRGTATWELYERGREAQSAIEAELARVLRSDGNGRDKVIRRWMVDSADVSAPVASSPREISR